MKPKAWLAQLFYEMKVFNGAFPLPGKKLVVFGYHRIRLDAPDFQTPFAADLFGPTAAEFEKQVVWLKRHAHILGETELIECIRTRRLPARRNAMITFDDGYLDNYTLAYPILKAHQVPAIFFVPTHLISQRRLGWWDIIAYVVNASAETEIRWRGRTFDLSGNREAVVDFFLEEMKLRDSAATGDLVNSLAEACQIPLPDARLQGGQLMTWQQVRQLADDGYAIGCHGHTHRVLATLSPAIQESEIARSMAILASKTRRPVRTIAYPVGGYDHFTRQTRMIAARCGLSAGFSCDTGWNHEGGLDPFDIKRFFAPDQVGLLAAETLIPELKRVSRQRLLDYLKQKKPFGEDSDSSPGPT